MIEYVKREVIIMVERKIMSLADKLKELRKNFCMTQDDIAELLDMSRTTFSKYENGAANPPLSVLRKLSAIYNVPIEYLIHDEPSSKMILNSGTEDKVPEEESAFQYFSQLTKEERMLILKLRLMKKEKKAELMRKIESEDE